MQITSPLYTVSCVRAGPMPVLTMTGPHLTFDQPVPLNGAPLLCRAPSGDAVLIENWTDALSQSFYVPAPLVSTVSTALGLSPVE